MGKKNFAVILAGCGVYDGAEVHESTAVLLAIDKAGAEYQCFAPDADQYHVVNHITGEEMNEKRNVLVESARIARGNIKDIKEFDASDFDALVIPGGFGVAKNLCSFAIDGANCTLNTETSNALMEAHKKGLPIGALCISPALLAKVLGTGTMTIGKDMDTATEIEKMGAVHKVTDNDEIVFDEKNKIVSTPCYMLDSPIHIIFNGASNVITKLFEIA